MEQVRKKTAALGDVLAALFDEAERLSSDPRVVARLATRALGDVLVRGLDAAGQGEPAEIARRLLSRSARTPLPGESR